MRVDDKTSAYFKNVKQVFLYLGDECNLLCTQCLYKPNVVMGKSIKKETAKDLLYVFAQLGAYKLTVLGGEISLYDQHNNWKALEEILTYAHSIGYRYIRIDTNGQFLQFFSQENLFRYIDESSFSLDGYDQKTNDILRGEGAFDRAVNSILLLKKKEYCSKLNITTCVTRQNTEIAGGIKEYILNMIAFSEKYGIDQLNFHGVFKMGVPMDTWTGESHLNPKEWYLAVNELINDNILNTTKNIRLPLHIITKKEFDRHPQYYGYCPCKLGERALLHPDGIIRVCSSMLSTPYGVAHYNTKEIVWNEYNNELQNHEMDKFTPCTNQKKMYINDICPICFSIKPYQDEIIWVENNVEGLRGEGCS